MDFKEEKALRLVSEMGQSRDPMLREIRVTIIGAFRARMRLWADLIISLALAIGFPLLFLVVWLECRIAPPRRRRVVLCLSCNPRLTRGEYDTRYLLFDNPWLDKFICMNLLAEEGGTMRMTDRLVLIEIARPNLASTLRDAGFRLSGYVCSWAIYFQMTARFAKKEQVDIIRAVEPHITGVLAVLLKLVLGVKFVQDVRANFDMIYRQTGQTIYGVLSHSFDRWLRGWVYRRADLVFGGNMDNLEQALRDGADPEKSRLVRSIAIAPALFDPPKTRVDVRDLLGLKDSRLLVFCSRLSPEKYPKDVIDSFSEVAKLQNDVKLIVAGDGSMRKELEIHAERLGLDENVVFLGSKPNEFVIDLLRSADLVVVPLAGSLLVEAALSAKPIVAYDCEWHSELVKHGETGLLVKFRDYKEMASAIITLLNDPDLSQKLGNNARKLALEMFHPNVIREIEAEHYKELLGWK